MTNKFLVHAKSDHVGVATDDLKKNETVDGVFMDSNGKITVKANEDVPLGHKIALSNLKKGEKVIEYGEPIGQATQDIKKGDHVHVHNIKTMRW